MLTSSQLSQIDVYIRYLGVICRVLRDRLTMVQSGPDHSLFWRLLKKSNCMVWHLQTAVCRLATVWSGPDRSLFWRPF
jgi:hypothetical protein